MEFIFDFDMRKLIETTEEFVDWLDRQPEKAQAQIEKRLLMIQIYGFFGDCKYLHNGLFELRWKNGRRVYFSKKTSNKILLLLGGLKNEQEKQIKKARNMLR